MNDKTYIVLPLYRRDQIDVSIKSPSSCSTYFRRSRDRMLSADPELVNKLIEFNNTKSRTDGLILQECVPGG